MERLIDADKLIDWIDPGHLRHPSELCFSEIDLVNIINHAPTVDAVPVVHGRWEDEYGGEYVNPRYRCSVCKGKALFKFERDWLGHHREVQALTPNCPHCGAKMDLEENE